MKKDGRSNGPCRPDQWISGPDPDVHEKYRAWVQQRNQAQWRGETWTITFDEFQQIWSGRWHLRGRGTDDLAMTRTDWTGPWTAATVALRTRKQLGAQQAEARLRGHRSPARQRELDQIAAATETTPVADLQRGSAAQVHQDATENCTTTSAARFGKESAALGNYCADSGADQNG